MQKLVQGIHRFRAEHFVENRELWARLSRGQNPETLFITCSDSRINPNLLTGTSPGELFIIRNAGNIVPPAGVGGGEAASIEFAVAGLKVKDIVVCGHSLCGAMKALLDPTKVENLPAMRSFLEHAQMTRKIVDEQYGHLDAEARERVAVQENVLVQLEQIKTHPTVAERLERGELRLHAWVFKIESGEVFAYQPNDNSFAPMSEATIPASPASAPGI